jgi:hypothetical protein
VRGPLRRVEQALDGYFELGRPPTAGERIAFRVFECFTVGGLCLFAWTWALDIFTHDSRFEARLAQAYALDARGLALTSAALVTVLLGLGLLRRRGGFAYLAALPLLHLQFVARYWPSEGLHHSHLLGMCLLAIAVGRALFADEKLRLRAALGTTYVLVGVAYLLAALSKLRNTGLDWIDGRNLQMWLVMNQVHRISKDQDFEFNALQELVVSHGWLATAILLPGLVVELLGPLICWRRIRLPYTTAVLLMHLGIALVFKIYFLWNIGLLILLGYPWGALIDRMRRKDVGAAIGRGVSPPTNLAYDPRPRRQGF